jgi:hypothetical protein
MHGAPIPMIVADDRYGWPGKDLPARHRGSVAMRRQRLVNGFWAVSLGEATIVI